MDAAADLHAAVARLQAVGLALADVKAEIDRVVVAQRANREALASLKSAAAEAAQPPPQRWVARPGGLWVQLPPDRAAGVLRAEAAELSDQLEALFQRQKEALAALEAEGLGPEHFVSLGSISSSSGGGGGGAGSGGGASGRR